MEKRDANIIDVATLDTEFRTKFTKNFAVQYPDCSVTHHYTEDEACSEQRRFRTFVGLNPITGE